jgi:para-nitrobenzyl esterase
MKALFAAALAALVMVGAAVAQDRPTVITNAGPVVGVSDGGLAVFKGIPYAAPPVGPLRWQPPALPGPWLSARDAPAYGEICPQPPRPDGVAAMGGGRPQSEDCLTLNVWAPKAAHGAPVMVWIHGGAFRLGSGGGPAYDGEAFARDGVILVSINYRLGALGWFAHPALTRAAGPGAPLANYGLMDQIAALEWVQANIGKFGGDPANVTVFGESAGGSSVLALLSAPRAKGLFAKAIVESGGGWQQPPTLAAAETAGAELATRAGLPGASATLEQLRALPPEKLFDVKAGLGAVGPIRDGRMLTLTPGEAFATGAAIDVPLIIGSNSYEASLMKAFPVNVPAALARLTPAQRAAYQPLGSDDAIAAAVFTDIVMGAPARWVAGKASTGTPSYLYYFSYVAGMQRARQPGAPHGGEILYVFGTGSKLFGQMLSDEDRAMEALAHSCWVGFAKTGTPVCAHGPAWPAYTPGDDRLMEFGVSPGVRQHLRKTVLDADETAIRLR